MTRITVLSLLCLVVAVLAGCGGGEQPKARSPRSATRPVPEGLWITDPPDSARVPYRPYVLGTVSDTSVSAV
ncbi:hypothetical protein FJY69_00350, partial [candidate division WOR-3 bacterium]|nr:hypothetical protein [candidate division WOR-3 bacterium]